MFALGNQILSLSHPKNPHQHLFTESFNIYPFALLPRLFSSHSGIGIFLFSSCYHSSFPQRHTINSSRAKFHCVWAFMPCFVEERKFVLSAHVSVLRFHSAAFSSSLFSFISMSRNIFLGEQNGEILFSSRRFKHFTLRQDRAAFYLFCFDWRAMRAYRHRRNSFYLSTNTCKRARLLIFISHISYITIMRPTGRDNF